jgi:Protein of unknown function (DUF3574)
MCATRKQRNREENMRNNSVAAIRGTQRLCRCWWRAGIGLAHALFGSAECFGSGRRGQIMRNRLIQVSTIGLILALLAGCQASSVPGHCPCEMQHTDAKADSWLRAELYFGLSIPIGGVITDAQWRNFLDTSVTPRFPDGFTVVEAQGRYRGDDHIIHSEPTRMLIILYPAAEKANANQRIEQLCKEYIVRFHQESVLRDDVACAATFISK